jgi:hypothetical protein
MSSSPFAASSAPVPDTPVTLPPGRAKLATSPVRMGSPAGAITIGMSRVAAFAASAAGVKDATRTVKRREFITLLGGAAAAWPLAARAQQVPRAARLGHLAPASNPDLQQALLSALRDFGYVEGHNLAIEYRVMLGQSKTYDELAAELARLAPDAIVVVGTPSTLDDRAADEPRPTLVSDSTKL